jgi:hypothetical protein
MYDHHNLNSLFLFHNQHLKFLQVSYSRIFFPRLNHSFCLHTQKDQQVQAIRLKQEQLQKLALQAKQRGIFIL